MYLPRRSYCVAVPCLLFTLRLIHKYKKQVDAGRKESKLVERTENASRIVTSSYSKWSTSLTLTLVFVNLSWS